MTKRKKFRIIFGLILLIVILSLGAVKFWANKNAKAAWFDTNYSYRKKIPVRNSGSAQTDFQVQVSIDTSTLVSVSKMQSDCDDIRFTDLNGKVLPYWIEPTTCNTNTTIIWIKVPSIPASGADIYFYYGNPSANAFSNTTNTFIRDMTQATVAWPLDDTTSTQSYARVLNQSVSAGRNIVLNGTFDADSLWTKGTGWTISGGVATSDGTGSSATLSQSGLLVIGRVYTVTYTVSSYTSGTIRVQMGSSGSGTNRTAVGTYTQTLVAAGSTSLLFQTNTAFNGSIDNIVLTEINIPANTDITATQLLTDGDMETAGTGSWSAGNQAVLTKETTNPHGGSQVIRITRNGQAQPNALQSVLTTGNVYRIYGYYRSDGTAIPRVINGSGTSQQGLNTITGWQSFDFVFVAGATTINFVALTDVDNTYVEFDDVTLVSYTNIRSDEIAVDGDMEGSDTSSWLAGNSATLTKDTTAPHGGSRNLRVARNGTNNPEAKELVLVSGKVYRVTGYVKSDGNATPVVLDASVRYTGTTSTSWTAFDVTFTANQIPLSFRASTSTGTQYVEWDDISITEVSPLVGVNTNGVSLGNSSGGHLGYAYSFDGNNDNVTLGNGTNSLNSILNVSEGTAVIWGKVSSGSVWTDGNTRYMMRLGNVSSNNHIIISKSSSNNTISAAYKAGGTTSTVAISTSTADWFQIVITWSKSSDAVKVYFNGVQSGSTQTGLGVWNENLTSAASVIGANGSAGSLPWSGMINDTRLYSRVLSDQEIADMYNTNWDTQTYITSNFPGHELLRKYSDAVTVESMGSEETTPGPILYWKFDDATSTSAKDSTQNANNGTLGGSTIPTWQTEDSCINAKCLYFDGSSSKVTGSAVAVNVQTVSFWVRPNIIATQGLVNLDGGTHVISTNSSGVITATGFTSPTYYINSVATTTPTLVANQWNYVEITTGTGFNSTSSFTIGTDGTNFIKGYIDEVRFYNYARSSSQAQVDYNTYAERLGKAQQKNFLSNGLVAYYKMDETSWDGTSGEVVDSSGNGNNGTGQNSITTTGGKFGNAGSFNDSSQYVLITDSTTLRPSSAITVSLWFKDPTTPAGSNDVLISKQDSGLIAFSINIQAVTGKLVFGLGDGSVHTLQPSSTNYADNQWHHVVGTWDGKTQALYADGVLLGTASFTGTISYDNANLLIGASTIGVATQFFNGNLDEARIYNRGLSSAEVSQLYNWAPEPVGYWKLDEAAAGTTNDSSGNSYGGTDTGTSVITGQLGKARSFNGTSDKIAISSTIPSTQTIEFWAKPSSTTQTFAQLTGSAYISASSGTLSATGFSSPTIYVNGVQTSTVTANIWQHIAVTTGTGISASAINFGIGNSIYYSGNLDDIKIYNYPRTSGQIVEDMNGSLAGSVAGVSVQALPKPMAWWKFDEGYGITANNSGFAGSSINGTLTNIASPATDTSGWTSSGKINKALIFDGSDDYVNVTGTGTNVPATFSYSAWVYPRNVFNSAGQIMGKFSNSCTHGQGQIYYRKNIGETNGHFVFDVFNSTGDCTAGHAITGDSYPINNWYHLVGTFDGTTASLYVNGVLAATGAFSGTFNTSPTDDFNIGSSSLTGQYFAGTIDAVKIYNTNLTADQVKLDMNANASENFGVTANAEASLLSDGAGNAPVGYWNLDENNGTIANDLSGNANNGTLTNGPTWASGKMGQAVNFDGTNDYITITRNSAFKPTSALTINAWFKTSSANNGKILSISSTSNVGYGISIVSGNGNIRVDLGNGSINGLLATGKNYADGVWHYATMTWDGSTQKIYVDGVLKSSASVTGSISYSSSLDLLIGANNSAGPQSFFSGLIDDVKIYNYARTAAQVAYDYNRGAPAAYWKLDECQGTTANDSTGNSNSGSISIGATGTQTSVGTCNTSSTAWGNGATGKFNASLNFDGADDVITVDNTLSNASTVSIWAKPTSTTVSIMQLTSSASITASSGVVSASGFTSPTIYVNGLVNGTLAANSWNHIVVTTATGITANAIKFGLVSSTYFPGQLDDIAIWNYPLSASQVKNVYNQQSGVRFGPSTGTP